MITTVYNFFEKYSQGYYGKYGGAFIPEVLKSTFDELTQAFDKAYQDPDFWKEYCAVMQSYSCRPTPITPLKNLSKKLGGAEIFCKREDLNQTGSHKINNVTGQGLLAKRMGKQRVIAETGAGQHGVATATMAARLGLECTIYMGAKDVIRQRPNVFWIEQLGAKVVAVSDGSATLKDAINETMRDWTQSMHNTHYILGTACGAHPFPKMVAWFQSIIGTESHQQIQELIGQMPDAIYACIGGGSNALGMFLPFLDEPSELVGVEAGGNGIESGQHAARMAGGSIGIVQGYKTYFLQDQEGKMNQTHSIAAGLDYVGISPILSHLYDTKRVRFTYAQDEKIIAATKLLIETEGIIPALESAHSFAAAIAEAPHAKGKTFLVNLSGRGDKDIFNIANAMQDKKWKEFICQQAQEL